MNSFEVVGYTADASIWCPDCAEKRYGAAALGICPECRTFIYPVTGDVCLECYFDYGECNMTDEEGNPVNAVFAGDEWDFQLFCEGCGCEIEVTVLQYSLLDQE